MKSIKYIFISTALLALGACSDFLDKLPYSLTPETYYNTKNELQDALTGVYSPLMQEQFYGNKYMLDNAGGDDLSYYQRSTPANSIMCNNANSSTEGINTFWRILYDGINRANLLLENVDKNTTIEQTSRDRVRAEALFLRSFYYFNLVQAYGDVPMRLQAINSPDNVSLARTPKQQVYDQLIKDIITSIPNLAVFTNGGYNGHVTQSAAQAILARIYMFRAGENLRDQEVGNTPTNTTDSIKAYFTHARDWALKVKNSGLHSLSTSYKTIYVDMCTDKYNSDGKGESIWEAELAGTRLTTEQAAGRIGNVIGFGSSNDYSTVAEIKDLKGMANPGYSYKFTFASTKLFLMYEAEGDTARGDWNITPYEYTFETAAPKKVSGRNYYFGKRPVGLTSIEGYPCTEGSATAAASKNRCCAKYRRELEPLTPKNKNYTEINAPIIHYSDVLLMIAEADNELNSAPTTLAFECINQVRNRANLLSLDNQLTKEDFRTALKNERAMELCFESIRRWDLIRWGDFFKNMNEMPTLYVNQANWSTAGKYAAAYYTVPKSYNYFPIPDIEMSVNKLITKNNPGW
ncbi:MAG: RagB/SusD family nutrient uptake outer membrane protein [Bacteroidales bacterium]|nr:RagB/SusD family nutrient uptake outer membrane protein [Bacteroidales bacterium]